MTQESQKVFSDPELLRKKLEIYLQTPKKVELYARAAEKFFANNEELKFKLIWIMAQHNLWGQIIHKLQ